MAIFSRRHPATPAATIAAHIKPGSASEINPNIGTPGLTELFSCLKTDERAFVCQAQSYLCLRKTLLNVPTASRPHNQPAHNADNVQKAWLGLGSAVHIPAISILLIESAIVINRPS